MDASLFVPKHVLLVAFLSYVIYLVGLVVYRLYFHPLANFPGPKYAAVSRWHEVYHEIVREGQFSFVIDEWHKKYGPIVRIVPDELHIKDSQFFDTLYTKAGRADKYEFFAGRFGSNSSILSTSSADLHAIRRAPLNPLFSRARIIQFEDTIRNKVDILVERFKSFQRFGKPFKINRAFEAFACDVVMRYSFGMDYNQLHYKDFEVTFHEFLMAASRKSYVSVQFPLVPWFFDRLPEKWLEKLEPTFAIFFKTRNDLLQQVLDFKKDRQEKKDDLPTTVFSALLDDPELPVEHKETPRVHDEAQVVIAAGIVTTAWALSVGLFHITNNPEIYDCLRRELEEAIPNLEKFPTWAELEKLPYLSGCIREAVRLSYPVASRAPRLLPKPVTYENFMIPARTPVSMTITDVSNDEGIFPEHDKFKPERWIGNPKTKYGTSLEQHFVCFQKGTRSCLSIKFELFETDYSDIKMVHDFFTPCPKLDSKGVQVRCLPDQ